jgi:hypothetical protein
MIREFSRRRVAADLYGSKPTFSLGGAVIDEGLKVDPIVTFERFNQVDAVPSCDAMIRAYMAICATGDGTPRNSSSLVEDGSQNLMR